MKTPIAILLFAASAAAVAPLGCKDNSCDPTLTHANPAKPDEQAHLSVGDDGLCHWPWYKDANWGTKCSVTEDCGAGLICLAPDLPICSRINCNPDKTKDTVCAPGFMCIQAGTGVPTVCVPAPSSSGGGGTSGGGSGGSSAQPSGNDTAGANASDGGATAADGGAAPAEAGAPSSGAAMDPPNIGTACTGATDTACKGGTFCETTMLHACTVSGCANPGAAKDACDAAAANGFVCYSSPPAPADGVCIHF